MHRPVANFINVYAPNLQHYQHDNWNITFTYVVEL